MSLVSILPVSPITLGSSETVMLKLSPTMTDSQMLRPEGFLKLQDKPQAQGSHSERPNDMLESRGQQNMAETQALQA